MTTQTITDPKDWRAGDAVRVEWPDGSVLTSRLVARWDGVLATGAPSFIAREAHAAVAYDGGKDNRITTVTREIPDIPEPTGLGAVVELACAAVIVRADDDEDEPWRVVAPAQDNGEWGDWRVMVENYGPAVRVLSAGVSDDADTPAVVLPRLAEEAGRRAFERDPGIAIAYDAGFRAGRSRDTGDEIRRAGQAWDAGFEAGRAELTDRLTKLADEWTHRAQVLALNANLRRRPRDAALIDEIRSHAFELRVVIEEVRRG